MTDLNQLPISETLTQAITDFKLPESLGFGTVRTPVMAQCIFRNGKWEDPQLLPWEPIALDPSAKVLHYGQAIFEGMKAYRNGKDDPILFRPDQNFSRFNASARRMAMPEISENIYIGCIDSLVRVQAELIPQKPGESLYVRPFMIGTQTGLGLAPSMEYMFMVITSPSGAYFSSDKVSVLIERSDCRAAPGGTGAAKVAGNYGGSIKSAIAAKELGYHQTLWLDASQHKYIEELSGMNFFAMIDNELYTPSLTDSILAGVTRDSLLKLAELEGIKTHEVPMDINELINKIKEENCTELFACGTAAVLTPIAELGEADGTRYPLKHAYGPVSKKLRETLVGIQENGKPAPDGWIHNVKLR